MIKEWNGRNVDQTNVEVYDQIVLEVVDSDLHVKWTSQKNLRAHNLVEQKKKWVARLAQNTVIVLYVFQGAKDFNFLLNYIIKSVIINKYDFKY